VAVKALKKEKKKCQTILTPSRKKERVKTKKNKKASTLKKKSRLWKRLTSPFLKRMMKVTFHPSSSVKCLLLNRL